MSEYFIRIAGEATGPHSLERLKLLAARRHLRGFHELSADGLTWTFATEAPEIFEDLAPPSKSRQSRPAAAQRASQPEAEEVPIEEAAEWQCAINNEACGPYTTSQVRQMLREGTLNDGSLLFREGMTDWGRLDETLPAAKGATKAAADVAVAAAEEDLSLQVLPIASIVLAAAGIEPLPFVGSAAAIVCGHLALSQLASRGSSRNRNFALWGLIGGYAGLLLRAAMKFYPLIH